MRVLASQFICWLSKTIWLIGVIYSLTLLLSISSLLVLPWSQLILIQVTSIPLRLFVVNLLIICLYLIILFIFYLPLLDLVTKIQSLLFSLFTSVASIWLEYSVDSQSINPSKTQLFLTLRCHQYIIILYLFIYLC